MINLKKHDPVADAVKDILQQEALKGSQHKIDKNNNNKVDAGDFAILRGEKKAVKKEEVEQIDELSKSTLGSYVKKAAKDTAVQGFAIGDSIANKKWSTGAKAGDTANKRIKGIGSATDRLTKEEQETVEEGIGDIAKRFGSALKKGAKAVDRVVTGGDKEDLIKLTQKQAGVPQTGKKPEPQKEEVEIVYEANIQPTSAKSRSHISNLSNPTVNSVTHQGKQIGLITKQPSGEYHAHHSAAKLAHAKSETFDTKDKAHQFIRNAHADAIKKGTLSNKFSKTNEEVEGKTLKQFRENAFDWKKKPEPTPNGGSGVKQGSRYGGSKQKEKPEQESDSKK